MNVVVVAPHPDDDAIGCGGTICLHANKGDRVVVAYLSSGELGLKHLPRDAAWRIREQEAGRCSEILGVSAMHFLRHPDWYLDTRVAAVAADLAPLLTREAPQLLYLPHEGETHPDHRAALSIVRAALRATGIAAPTLLTYEVWTPLPDWYHVENVTPVMRRKLAAIRCHESQVTQLPYDRASLGLGLYRGATAGACRYAEIFQTAPLQ